MTNDPPTAVISKATADHYVWGGSCDGWRLVQSADLSIIHEHMPPGTRESRHYHVRARQFFFVLSGTLVMECAGARHTLAPGEGLQIPPGQPHQAINEGRVGVEFLVTSAPTTSGDRIECP